MIELVVGKKIICKFPYWNLVVGKEYGILEFTEMNIGLDDRHIKYEVEIDDVILSMTDVDGSIIPTYMKLSDGEINKYFYSDKEIRKLKLEKLC